MCTKITKLFLMLTLACLFTVSCGMSAKDDVQQSKENTASITAKAAVADGFYIANGKLYDANGNPFIMRGVNHAHTWFKTELDTVLPVLAQKGANAVRVVLSDGTHPEWGSMDRRESLESLKEIIAKCKENRMIAVLEVHDATGSNDVSRLNNAVNYWIEMKEAFIGEEAYVIINIANEWYGEWSSTGWASGYISAIQALRAAGLKHTFIVDCAGWGQYPQSIFDEGLSVFNADVNRNTMFAIHMYEYSGGTAETVRSNIDNVLNLGLALTIGEFGHRHSSGDVAEQAILDYCRQVNVGWLAWSWKGNSGGVEYLDLSNDWAGTSLTDWGNTIFNGTNGISETSATCTIFGGSVNLPPSVSITGPSEGSEVFVGEQVTLTASAADSDGVVTLVEFYIDGVKVGEDATNPYSISWQHGGEGEYTVTAKATDDDGDSSISSAVTFKVVDKRPPVIELTSPVDNSVYSQGDTITITASASDVDGNIVLVEFYADGIKIGEDAAYPYSYSWDNVATGEYEITAKATDIDNLSAFSDIVNISVLGTPGDITVAYTIMNDWGNGFQASIKITNNSAVAVDGWELEFAFSGNQAVSSGWIGDFTQTGQNVTVKNLAWNRVLQSGQTLELGFTATYSGTNSVPAQFIFNGDPVQ